MDIRLFGLNHRRVVVEASVFCRSAKSSPQESCISNLFSCQILRNICECLESLRLSASPRPGHGLSLSQASYKVAPDEGCLNDDGWGPVVSPLQVEALFNRELASSARDGLHTSNSC